MMRARKRLLLSVFATALADGDTRTLAIVQGMERAFPGLHLGWKISKQGQLIPLPRRDEWLTEETRRGKIPLVCNGDENDPIAISGLQIPASQAPKGQPLLDVHAELPLDKAAVGSVENMLEGVAEGARAYWGHVTPEDAALDIAYQTAPTLEGPPAPRRGLPALKLFEHIRSPEIPYYLGWLNYWSAASARAIGFPEPARDAELLTRARRTATGGWIVQLTEAPLELDNPAHLDALKRAYERFPEIGGRSP